MAEFLQDIWEHVAGSFMAKKWVAAAVAVDYGNSQAIAVAPVRRNFTAFQIGPSMIENRSGAASLMGIGVRYRVSSWEAGQLDSAGAYTVNTAAAQDGTVTDFTLHTRTDGGSGFLVAADEAFNTLGIVQGQAGDQVAPVQVIEYWNGTGWVSWASASFLNDALDTGLGEKILNFPLPMDWVKGGSGTNVPQTRYCLRVRQATGGAGTVNPVASQLFVGLCKIETVSVPDGATVSLFREAPMHFPRSGDAIFPLTDHPSNKNYAEISYQYWA